MPGQFRDCLLGSDNTTKSLYQPVHVVEFPFPNVHRSCSDRMFFILSHIQSPPVRILEIGCCLGYFSYYLACAGYKVTAVDMSKGNIDFCKSFHAHENVNYVNGDGFSFLQQDKFDVVICLAVTHHIHRQNEKRACDIYTSLSKQDLFFETAYNDESDFVDTNLNRKFVLNHFSRMHSDHSTNMCFTLQPVDKSTRDIFYMGKNRNCHVRKFWCSRRSDNYRIDSICRKELNSLSFYDIRTSDQSVIKRWNEINQIVRKKSMPFLPMIYRSDFGGRQLNVFLEDVEMSGFLPMLNYSVDRDEIISFVQNVNSELAKVGLRYFDFTPKNMFYNEKTKQFKLVDIVESLELNKEQLPSREVVDNFVNRLDKRSS